MTKTIGIISRIEKGKGQDVLIDAARILIKKFKDLNVLIVGEGDNTDLVLKINNYKLERNIHLLNYQKNKIDILKKLDVFVFPTSWPLEGFGLVLLEAMQNKVPIVSTNFGPVPEVVGDSALLVPINKPIELAKAIEKVLTNKKLAESMIKKGIKRVKMFDIKKIAQLYEVAMQETVNANA